MGVFKRSHWEGCSAAINLVSSAFLGYVLQSIHKLAKKTNAGRFEVEEKGLLANVRMHCTGWRLTIAITKLTVACFFALSVMAGLMRVLFFGLCHDCTVHKVLWVCSALLQVLAYTQMFLAHFERLRLTFVNSPLELPQWSAKVMYGVWLLFALFFLGTFAFRYAAPEVAAFCLVLAIVLYFVGVCIQTRAFYKKTIAAANTKPPDVVLLQVAVRITVLLTVSVLSTTLTYLFWTFLLGTCHKCYFLLTFGNLLSYADHCLSSFCLMCTFAGAVAPYKRVFGCLDAALMKHVKKTIGAQPTADSRVHRLHTLDSEEPETV